MTLMAGILSRVRDHAPPASICAALRGLISRDPADEVRVFEDRQSYFVKVDTGTYLEPGVFVGEDNSLSLLAGEPLLETDGAMVWQSRERDLALIHDGLARNDLGPLRRARGVFCAAHYDAATGALKLISDKLCLRPLYFWADEKYLIFTSALRVLESLDEVPKKMDVRAVTEIVGLGYPLADRTPYANIFLLRAGEIVEVRGEKISRAHYWRWDDIAPSAEPEEELLRRLYEEFRRGVAQRIREDRTTAAYLSGGLDSRCVVAALRERNVIVHTFNFARPGTQDLVLGREFAERVGAIHKEVPKDAGDHVPDYSALMASVWRASKHRASHPAERPSIVWSGEGGSVALGHVHMSREIVDLMRAGRIAEAIEEYVRREYVHVPAKLFRAEVFADLAGVINKGLSEELGALRSEDAARSFYLFLLLNDQRRKLARHFENIDRHKLEFQLPFFDSRFLAAIVAAPVDFCLRHKLYVRWLKLFPAAVTEVPWQAYPGHEPCPLPVPPELSYQWDARYQQDEHRSQKRALAREAAELLEAKDFPTAILSRKHFRLAAWVHASGWRDYEYLIKAARTYHTYWRVCGGDYRLPGNLS